MRKIALAFGLLLLLLNCEQAPSTSTNLIHLIPQKSAAIVRIPDWEDFEASLHVNAPVNLLKETQLHQSLSSYASLFQHFEPQDDSYLSFVALGDDDFDLDAENEKKHEDESETQMDTTRTPSQSRTTTATTEAAKDRENSNKKSVTLQHQEKQKETAKEAEFTNQPNAKGKRFQIQMNKVENLVQHLLHHNKNETSSTHDKEGSTTGRNDTGSMMMNKDKSKNLFSAPMPSASSPSTTSPYHSRIHPRNTEEEEALAADELVRAVAAAKRIQHS